MTDQSELEKRYVDKLESLRAELLTNIPNDEGAADKEFLESDASTTLDDQLAQFVVLKDAAPKRLAEFGNEDLVEELLANGDLMKQMLLADGAKGGHYGPAMEIYTKIQGERQENDGAAVLDRLALAISLEHAVPMRQDNPKDTASPDNDFVDPVARYLNYEKAYLEGELDPSFESLTTFELRMVVDGDEPDETAAWGRDMLRTFRPDHVLTTNDEWRYSGLVRTEVRYGSQMVKYDRPELQRYQNIVMNGGICGRRAFVGRFILRAFGIPTTARPSRGHGALCHWTRTNGWVVNLGGGWGCGWTKNVYHEDVDFLATTQARKDEEAYWNVKRCQWIGDVLGEKRVYGPRSVEKEKEKHGDSYKVGFWNALSLETQKAIIDQKKHEAAIGKLENQTPTIAQRILAATVPPEAKTIVYKDDNEIYIPAAAYNDPGKTKDVHCMTSFLGGLQIFLPAFAPQGLTMLRGGAWKEDANGCCSGQRLLSGGYGKYEDWGFRVVFSPSDSAGGDDGAEKSETMTINLDGTDLELVYIKPGSFLMGHESTTDSRFGCVEVPKHQVTITKGYYLGKYPVTQAQYQAMIGSNPSKSTKDPNCPVDNIGEDNALEFCTKVTEVTGQDLRLPTEAEWEFACRAGCDEKWFFGDDPSQLGEYAWCKENSGGKSHPVGQKKPNPWGIYDIYGNVRERISDKYAKDYYAKSPPNDPTGPSPGIKSAFHYKFNVQQSGEYSLTAKVSTVNYNQSLKVSVNGTEETLMEVPFTVGKWQDSEPVVLSLKEGENTIRFWRDMAPQYGLAVKDFTFKPAQ